MAEPAKLVGARVYLAGPISFVLGIVLCLPIVFAAQTTPDRVLTMGSPADTGMSEPVLKAAVSLYSEAVARGDVLGAVLLVARHGKVVVYEAVGVRDREKNLLMQKDTPFQIQSMTKPLVASAALILADRGKLQLDDPVSRYIPAFAQGQSQAIKVHNLVNLTSGFRIPTNFIPKTNAEIPDGSTLQREVARFPEIGPAVTPGSSYDYSNPGYNTLAAVIEVASGETIDRFLADAVFKPLGMNNTYAHWRGQPRNGLPPVYEKKNGAWEIVHEDEAPFARGSGGLVSTAWDYAKFCQMYLNQGVYAGVRVMSKTSTRQASSVTIHSPFVYPTAWQLEQRRMQPRWYYRRDSRGLGIDIGYGLGWVISSDGTFRTRGELGDVCMGRPQPRYCRDYPYPERRWTKPRHRVRQRHQCRRRRQQRHQHPVRKL